MTLLSVSGLTKSFGGLVAVNNVSLDLREGEILGLIGPNGSGKTTVFNLITGFLAADSGKVTFKGEDICDLRPDQVCKKGICRTFQLVRPFQKMTVFQNALMGAFCKEKNFNKASSLATEILEFADLSSKANSAAKNLTIADKKRLEIARALATRPELLLIDEAVSGLTPKETEKALTFLRKVNDQGVSILMIEHVMKAVMSISERIIVLAGGKVIAKGNPKQIAENKKVIEVYLGERYVA